MPFLKSTGLIAKALRVVELIYNIKGIMDYVNQISSCHLTSDNTTFFCVTSTGVRLSETDCTPDFVLMLTVTKPGSLGLVSSDFGLVFLLLFGCS